jgi:glycosyltransferase involved in cell wall biosynthesis
MRALLLDYPQPPPEAPKDASPTTARVLGANVYASTMARALVRFGTYDAYYHLDRDPLAELAAQRGASDTADASRDSRTSTIAIGELDRLTAHDHLVLMTPRSSPQGLVSPRALLGDPPRPITACIHTLSGITAPYLSLGMLFANLDTHDAVLCSTHAGKRVVERLVDLAMDALKDDIRKSLKVRLPVIPLGTDCRVQLPDRAAARRRLGIPDDAVVMLYVGRLSVSSKCDLGPLLIAFARHLHDPSGRMRLLIAGDDTEYRSAGAIRDWCGALGCSESISVFTDITDPQRRELLAAADIFVSLSDNIQETFGLTIVEAMAAGLPVVASDWDGYRELIGHGVTGFLAPTFWPVLSDRFDLSAPPVIAEQLNSVLAATTAVDFDAVMHYVRTLANNPERRAAMGEAGAREARQRYDWPVVIKQYEELWAELAEKAKSRTLQANLRRTGPLAYRCQDVFCDYPTDIMDDGETLALTATGEWWLERIAENGLALEPLPGTPAGFSNERLRRVAQSLASSGPVTMTAWIARAEELGLSALTLRLIIGRLLKYGFVRRERQAAV